MWRLFQPIADWIYRLRFPAWLRPYVQELNDIMVALLKEAGQSYLNYLKEIIMEAAANDKLTATEKYEYVESRAKAAFMIYKTDLSTSELKTVINYLVTNLKIKFVIP